MLYAAIDIRGTRLRPSRDAGHSLHMATQVTQLRFAERPATAIAIEHHALALVRFDGDDIALVFAGDAVFEVELATTPIEVRQLHDTLIEAAQERAMGAAIAALLGVDPV